MAEIKSTLELAMERIGKMSISKEEKEEIRRKEIVQKATSLFNRYVEGTLSNHEMTREIERMETGGTAAIRESVLSRLMDALSLDEGREKILEGIKFLTGKNVDDVKQTLESLYLEYEKEKEEVREEIRTRIEETLRRDGIYGSAVVPPVEGSDRWKERMAMLQHAFREKVEEVRDVLKRL